MVESNNITLLYCRNEYSGPLFVEEPRKQEMLQLKLAIWSSDTWADFRKLCPESMIEDIWEQLQDEVFFDENGPIPFKDEPFDPSLVSGYDEERWPPRHDILMMWLLPEDLVKKYGTVHDSMIGPRYVSFAPSDTDILVSELEARGYACIEDSTLIKATNPWDFTMI